MMHLLDTKTDVGFNCGTTIHDEPVTIEATRWRGPWLTRCGENVIARGTLITCQLAAGKLLPEHRRTNIMPLPPFAPARALPTLEPDRFAPEDGYALSDPKRNGPGGSWR